MVLRLLVGICLCVGLAAGAYFIAALQPAALRHAASLQGERWYSLDLDGR